MAAVCDGLDGENARRRGVEDADLDALADRDVVARLAPPEQPPQRRDGVDVQVARRLANPPWC